MKKKSIIGYIMVVLFVSLIGTGICYGKAVIMQQQLAKKVVRFHVLANSDSPKDQELKLMVRDAIGAYLEEGMKEVANKNQCESYIITKLPALEQLASEVIHEQGYSYEVHASLEQADFPVKTYGNYTFPAGNYEALRVIIGEGKGKNWWCVMYPNMCFENSMYEVTDQKGEKILREVLDEKEYEAVLSQGKYQIRLRLFDFLR